MGVPQVGVTVHARGCERITVGGEGDTVHTILVALLAFGALDKNTGLGIPDADALVQAACSDEAVVGRDGNGGDAVFDLESQNALVLLDIPKSDSAVPGTGGDVTTIRGEVQRIDVLLVARELVENALAGNVPDLRLR